MATLSTANELIEYCLRALGKPVININVAPEQIEDRVDEAMQFYIDNHFDASTKTYFECTLTQQDLDNGYITLPSDVISVLKVVEMGAISLGAFSYERQLMTKNRNIKMLDLSDYVIKSQFLNTISDTIRPEIRINYIRHANRLVFPSGLVSYNVGDKILIELYQAVDPLTHTNVYNDYWLKKYLTCLIKRQWGENLKKLKGVQLIGGVQLDGQAIYDEAINEITKLEEEVAEKYQQPTDFFMA